MNSVFPSRLRIAEGPHERSFQLIANDQTGRRIRVEEYKLPTFRVEFSPLEGEYTYGDTVTIKGKAQTFSGCTRSERATEVRVHP
jgi:hypothetical protein